jgi:hypothetical protein
MVINILNINPRRQLFTVLICRFRGEPGDSNIPNINPKRQLFTILIRGFRGEPHDNQYSKYQSQETALYSLEEQS